MGADLYINSLPDKTRRGGFEVSEEAVKSGYFRDAYNGWGLFAIMSATLGETISWWQQSDRKEFFDGEGNMTPQGCKKWWAEMQPKFQDFLGRKTIYRSDYLGDGKYKNIMIRKKDDIKAVKEHAELFIKFYRYACELGSSVRWSV